MRRAVRRGGVGALLVAILWMAPGAALAQGERVSGLLIRVEGDVVVSAGESADLVLVVSGDAEVRGRAAVVVVVGGDARLVGARVGHLVVVRGTAELRGRTVVEGDVWLTMARLDQKPAAAVLGAVHRGVARFGWGWLAVSPRLSLGVAVVVVGVGLLAVAGAPRRMMAAGGALTRNLPGAAAWAVMLFVAAPAAAMLAFFTVVGLPASLLALGVLLPLAGLAGFAVAALRLGTWLWGAPSPRPYGAVALGSVLLLAFGLVPVAGQVGVLLACALGAGALARTFGRERGDGVAVAAAAGDGPAGDGPAGGEGPEPGA